MRFINFAVDWIGILEHVIANLAIVLLEMPSFGNIENAFAKFAIDKVMKDMTVNFYIKQFESWNADHDC